MKRDILSTHGSVAISMVNTCGFKSDRTSFALYKRQTLCDPRITARPGHIPEILWISSPQSTKKTAHRPSRSGTVERKCFSICRWNNLNVDIILGSRRLVTNYVECLLNQKPCPAEGKDLKSELKPSNGKWFYFHFFRERKKCSLRNHGNQNKLFIFHLTTDIPVCDQLAYRI